MSAVGKPVSITLSTSTNLPDLISFLDLNSAPATTFNLSGDLEEKLVEALYRTIPQDQLPLGHETFSKEQIIACYNDTRHSQQEIIAWYERALIGIREG